jgi:hypothetical protein
MLAGGGRACVIDSSELATKKLGDPCDQSLVPELCPVASVCDRTCKPQCNGPSDATTCATGSSCTALVDAQFNGRISAYVCK